MAGDPVPPEVPNEIGFAALDALPMQAAVVDTGREIVYTNRAWRAFADANG